jgi:hypothetical protein
MDEKTLPVEIMKAQNSLINESNFEQYFTMSIMMRGKQVSQPSLLHELNLMWNY